MTPYQHARQLIDQAHSADPVKLPDGLPTELIYADRMETWVIKLVPDAPEILRLAARCQHLERWVTPRDSFPNDRPGYLTWRKSLYHLQASRAKSILLESGVSAEKADEAYQWVSKSGIKSNAGTQALEDAAVLVFLEHEIGDFASRHADYPRSKFIGILKKSWAKLSPDGQAAALTLNLPPAIADMVKEAADP